MPIIEVTTYDVVCSYPGCYETLDGFGHEATARRCALESEWTERDGELYCPKHAMMEEPHE